MMAFTWKPQEPKIDSDVARCVTKHMPNYLVKTHKKQQFLLLFSPQEIIKKPGLSLWNHFKGIAL